MSKERIIEIKDLLLSLERRIRPLQWDSDRNQINEFQKQKLERLCGERDILVGELDQLRQPQ